MRLGERGFPKPSATGICTRIMNWCKACNAVDTQGKTLAYKCLERAQGRIASCPNQSTIEMRSARSYDSYDMHDSASGARRPRCRIHVYLKHVKKQSKGKKQKSKAREQKVQKIERERERERERESGKSKKQNLDSRKPKSTGGCCIPTTANSGKV